jgi:hypothetical protein
MSTEQEAPLSPVVCLRLHFQVSKGSDSKPNIIPADLYIRNENSQWFQSKRDEILSALAELLQSNYTDIVAKSKNESSEVSGLSRINGDGIAIVYGIRSMDSAPYTLLSSQRRVGGQAKTIDNVSFSLKIRDMGRFLLAPVWLFPYNPATDAGKPLPLDIY